MLHIGVYLPSRPIDGSWKHNVPEVWYCINTKDPKGKIAWVSYHELMLCRQNKVFSSSLHPPHPVSVPSQPHTPTCLKVSGEDIVPTPSPSMQVMAWGSCERGEGEEEKGRMAQDRRRAWVEAIGVMASGVLSPSSSIIIIIHGISRAALMFTKHFTHRIWVNPHHKPEVGTPTISYHLLEVRKLRIRKAWSPWEGGWKPKASWLQAPSCSKAWLHPLSPC